MEAQRELHQPNYVALQVAEVPYDKELAYNLFVRIAGHYIKYRHRGDMLEKETIDRLKHNGLQVMYADSVPGTDAAAGAGAVADLGFGGIGGMDLTSQSQHVKGGAPEEQTVTHVTGGAEDLGDGDTRVSGQAEEGQSLDTLFSEKNEDDGSNGTTLVSGSEQDSGDALELKKLEQTQEDDDLNALLKSAEESVHQPEATQELPPPEETVVAESDDDFFEKLAGNVSKDSKGMTLLSGEGHQKPTEDDEVSREIDSLLSDIEAAANENTEAVVYQKNGSQEDLEALLSPEDESSEKPAESSDEALSYKTKSMPAFDESAQEELPGMGGGKNKTAAAASSEAQRTRALIQKLLELEKKKPHDITVKVALAKAYEEANRLDDAIALYKKMKRNYPTSSAGPLGLIEVFIKKKWNTKAITEYEELIQALPKDPNLAKAKAFVESAQEAEKAEKLKQREQQNKKYAEAQKGKANELSKIFKK